LFVISGKTGKVLSFDSFSTIGVPQILHCLLGSVLECFVMKLVNREFVRIFFVG